MTTPTDSDSRRGCPCGSGRTLAACCGDYLSGTPAPSAEALMRSRYTAFVLADERYLRETWHPRTRPQALDITSFPVWTGLDIRRVEAGEPADGEGTVEFVAHFLDNGRAQALHECSRFVQENGRWYYLDGQIISTDGMPAKTGRNEPCPCGSGRKFKRCCGQ